jgi:hypothetical protein
MDRPWSPPSAKASSAVFTFDELATRLVLGSVKIASSNAAIAAAKFTLLNHVPLSQMASRPRAQHLPPASNLQRGHRLHSPGHQRRAAAAQHAQVGRVFEAKVVRETGAGGRAPQRLGQLLLISGRRRTRSEGEEHCALNKQHQLLAARLL